MSQARASRDSLSGRLAQVQAEHDLGRREVLATEKDIRRLTRIGAAPNPTEYWHQSALPRAARLVEASMSVIAEEGATLAAAIDGFFEPLEHGELKQWAKTAEGHAVTTQAAGRAVAMLTEAVEPSEEIHALGRWWQERLKRAAMRRSLFQLMRFGSDNEAVIGRAELRLLDGPPWTHSDRLLSAFEIANGEIKNQVELVAEELTERVIGGSLPIATTRHHLTIELRG